MLGMRGRGVNEHRHRWDAGNGKFGNFGIFQPLPTRWPARPGVAGYFLAAFRPLFLLDRQWSAGYTF
jgi:hypothetical protein